MAAVLLWMMSVFVLAILLTLIIPGAALAAAVLVILFGAGASTWVVLSAASGSR